MSFWSTSDNDTATNTGTEFESGGGNFDPIPEGTTVLAMPDEVEWKDSRDQTAEFISVRWSVVKPEEYANRKVFSKLWVTDHDPNVADKTKAERKRDKALRMLAAIDANAGGKLAKKSGKPTDDELALALTNKMMTIRLGVWKMNTNDGEMSGNWVQAVQAKDAYAAVAQKAKARAKPIDEDDSDGIPF